MSGTPARPLCVNVRSAQSWIPTLPRDVLASLGQSADQQQAVEYAMRPIAIGKMNWLFTGSERAGRRVAVIQSLFATAKLNALDPARWLVTVLERLPTCPSSQIDSLLPLSDFSYR